MISQLVILASLFMVTTVFLVPVIGVRRVILLQITLMSISHVYATGVAMSVTMAIYYMASTTSKRDKKAIIYVPKAIVLIWTTWLVFTFVSWLANGISIRGVMQGVEFIFYGMLICFVYDIGKRRVVAYDHLLIFLSLASIILAVLFVILGIDSSSEWPVNLIGRNEGAFFLVLAGLGSTLYLIEKCPAWRKIIPSVAALIILLGIFSTGSRSGAASSIIIVLMYTWSVLFKFSLKYIFLSLAFITLMVLFMLPIDEYLKDGFDITHNYSNKERYALLVTSYDLFLQKPIVGWGWGSIEPLMQKYSETEGTYPHPHSTYARFAVELGIAGLFVLVTPLLILFYQSIKSLRFNCNHIAVIQGVTTLSMFLFSFTDALFYGANRAIVLSIMLGICLSTASSMKRCYCLVLNGKGRSCYSP